MTNSSLFLCETEELSTVRDFIRYAVTNFSKAELHYGHGSSSAIDEAVFLVLESLNLNSENLEGFADCRLTKKEKKMLEERIASRINTRCPSAYIIGQTHLAGFRFRSDSRALVPRSFLAELLLSGLFNPEEEDFSLLANPHSIHSVLDLCTGGGSLAIIAAHVFPNASIDACDLSEKALSLAEENIKNYQLDQRITLYHGNLYAPVQKRTYDLILTNPPYVKKEAMETLPQEYSHEPALALNGGEDGLDLIRDILLQAKTHLNSSGGLLCEVGAGKMLLEKHYPNLPFVWLDTAETKEEVFWLEADSLT